MRVPDDIRRAVVFIGGVSPMGEFVPLGTGFVVKRATMGRAFQQVVTCTHVIDLVRGDTVWLRLNKKDGTCEPVPTRKGHWYSHPDSTDRNYVDVSVMPSAIPTDQFDIMHISIDEDDRGWATPEIITSENIGVGDDVFLTGLFTNHYGEARNIPVVRCGTLSSMPEEPVETKRGFVRGYLVEAHSIGGLSGSPAFVQMAPFRVIDGTVMQSLDRTHYFLGMVQGHFKVQKPSDVVQDEDEAAGEFNTGIGLVIPADLVLEAIDQPELVRQREEIVDRKRRETGFEFDVASAVPLDTEPSTKADNPQHREDFNRLLDAAVTVPKPDDQT